ncbi:hypothetical protein EDI_122010 [Entamoeba dispar SAW760]|uniref:Uncharacterized protein n=1 Tax=Entamoeba dispar (strain ATCC PRA-260 / SAW760) TaxID=370354 RepID=B0EQD9_ENTDS|nr:uncharacterized protein EDI_122010 [Entamoeba dispar SAW760]EDR23264.1 hypothetical protein EDI_122010 [Entamoeba dispar SAW760]|eukprot:EDR23264.1 hypothetical protein EDI_122010 [Entamoeba dispar SAW760]
MSCVEDQRVILCPCTICRKVGFFSSEKPKIKTTRLCVLILQSLKEIKPLQDYFNLKDDVYLFIQQHWNILSNITIFKKQNWKKSILDAFNHCPQIKSGKELFNNIGYYKLKDGIITSISDDTEILETMNSIVMASIQNVINQLYNNLLILNKFGNDLIAQQHSYIMMNLLTSLCN